MQLEIPVFEIFTKGIFMALKGFYPFFLSIGAFFAVKWFLRQREMKALSQSGIDQIDKMSGKAFEKYLEVLFEKLGFKVERTSYVGDYGADLVAVRDGLRTVIQAKRYKGRVGVKAIQEAVASKGYYGCERAMVVTNSDFTDQARHLAASNDVSLWNRKELAQAMNSMNLGIPTETMAQGGFTQVVIPQVGNQTLAVAAITTNQMVKSNSNGSVCTMCGKTVSEKVRDYCLNHEKRFRGKIYCYDHQRQV